MPTPKDVLWQTLLKIFSASVFLTLLLPYAVPAPLEARGLEPLIDPSRLVFETVAGDYGNIYNVIQDKDGFLWLAGINDIIKYNGYDAESIYSGEQASALFEDSEGLIWMIVRSGVTVYDKKAGKKTDISPIPTTRMH